MTTRHTSPVPGDAAIWVDGAETSSLQLPDRGLDFGDGLFETLLVKSGRPQYPDLHLARLQSGCQALAFPDCNTAVRTHLENAAAAIAVRGWHWASLRITLTRGAGPRGYAPPENAQARIIIAATRLGETTPEMAAPAELCLAAVRWPTQPALTGLKHLNRLEQVLAAREYLDAEADEAVMLDQQGRVVSVAAGNLFIVSDGEILTPGLHHCGIRGTRRDLIMRRWAPAEGLVVREGEVSIEKLEQAEEAFYSNSLIGLRPVASFRQRRWTTHTTCEALYRQYLQELS